MTEAQDPVPTLEPEVEAKGEDQVEDEGAIGGAGNTISEIGEVAERVIQALGSGVDDAEDSVREGLVQAEKTIREHPLAALGMAAGVGFLVGVLMTRGGK
jgi:ElaB/YqjD/DUF883 family membrane-anchored ribosome-binding protein